MRWIRKIFSIFNIIAKIFKFLLLIIMFAFIVVLLAEKKGVTVPESAALVLAPSGILVEQLEGDLLGRALAEVRGNGVQQTLVKDVIDSLEAAEEDDRIGAVVLALDKLQGGGLPKLEVIANAIDAVRESGKKVIAVGDGFTQEQYYLAAHADEIYMHEFGTVMIDGYGNYRTYLKGVIDKLRIDLNVFQAGKYKSFVEPFTRTDMSEEDKEASGRWLEALWAAYQGDVVEARGLEPGSLDTFANKLLEGLAAADGDTANMALNAGLVDHLGGRHAARDSLIELVGESADDEGDYSRIGFRDYLQDVRLAAGLERKTANVGVLVAAGEIVNGGAELGTIGGDTLAGLVNQAANDDSIEAVVLRVDSPGGSMFASEVVFEGLKQLKARGKPLIVSMSTLAASGGYYIAMPADEIWASKSTITGSIGVGALIPTFQRSLGSLGINVDGIGTTRLAGQFRLDRELGADMKQMLQLSVERAYQVFVEKVAAERGMSIDRAGNLARGRVWIGTDAFELGLIDEFGGLAEAIKAAARRADLAEGEYGIKYVERELTFRERLLLEFAVSVRNVLGVLGIGMGPDRAQESLVARVMATIKHELAWLDNLNDPRGLYYHCFCELP